MARLDPLSLDHGRDARDVLRESCCGGRGERTAPPRPLGSIPSLDKHRLLGDDYVN